VVNRSLTTAIIVLVAWHCSPAPDALPKINDSLRPPLTDTQWPAGEAREALAPLEPDLHPCVAVAWRVGCEGHLEFELAVDEWGNVLSVAFDGESTPALRTCVEDALSALVVLPAVDSSGNRVDGKIEGSLNWRPDLTGVAFGNVGGVIPAIRPECHQAPIEGAEEAR